MASCVTAPVETSRENQIVQWYGQGKTQLEGQTQTFSIRSYTKNADHGRVEVLGPVGMVMAQFVWSPEGTQVVLPKQKKYFSFSKRAVSLSSVLGFDLTVASLNEVLLDEDFSDPRWQCSTLDTQDWKTDSQLSSVMGALSSAKASKAYFERCRSSSSLEFTRLRGVDGRFFIGNKVHSKGKKVSDQAGYLQFQLLQVRSKVEDSASAWFLDPPEGFKVIRK